MVDQPWQGQDPPQASSSWSGWIERCDGLLNQFELLQPTQNDPAAGAEQESRRQQLQQLRERQPRQQLQVGLAGVSLPPQSLQPELICALKAPCPSACTGAIHSRATAPTGAGPCCSSSVTCC